MFADGNLFPEVIVRFYTDVFVGSMVLHCHFSDHNDFGMMAEVEITGEEGAT